MKKIQSIIRSSISGLVCMAIIGSFAVNPLTVCADSIDSENTIVTLGADLNSKEYNTVLELLDLSDADLEECTVLEITNADEHNYLDDYLSSNVIGSRALSSIKLVKTEEGNGINVETQNISYCTDSMYINALATAGIEDADVTVVGPFSISGTAALVGVMKAYEEISGEVISEEVKDAATDELVTTGEIADTIDDSEKAAELIGIIKNEVVSQGLDSESEIKAIVEQAAEEMEIPLTDSDVDSIVSTMSKISKLDLDVDSLKDQAQGLYDKIQDMDIHIDKEKADGLFQKIMNFFQKVYNKIIELFS